MLSYNSRMGHFASFCLTGQATFSSGESNAPGTPGICQEPQRALRVRTLFQS